MKHNVSLKRNTHGFQGDCSSCTQSTTTDQSLKKQMLNGNSGFLTFSGQNEFHFPGGRSDEGGHVFCQRKAELHTVHTCTWSRVFPQRWSPESGQTYLLFFLTIVVAFSSFLYEQRNSWRKFEQKICHWKTDEPKGLSEETVDETEIPHSWGGALSHWDPIHHIRKQNASWLNFPNSSAKRSTFSYKAPF